MLNREECFRKAYRNFDLFPLVEPQKIEDFRVDYGQDTLLRLRSAVVNGPAAGKVIFTGHRGCGKSTLLVRFAREMQAKYFVVQFSIADMVEMSGVDHINILYSVAMQLLSKSSQRDIAIAEEKRKEIINWLTTTRSSAATEELKAQLGANVDLKVIFGKLLTESTFREEIKQTYEKRAKELVGKIDEVAKLIQTKTDKEILVVIDDLDKLDLKLVDDIFRNNVNALFLPKFRIVFTIPISVLRNIDIRTTLSTASGAPIQQMEVAKFYAKDDRHNPTALPNEAKVKILLEMVYKRFSDGLTDGCDIETFIEPDIARKIVLLSGGVLREMVRISSECCTQCLLKLMAEPENRTIKINQEILELALRELRNEFAANLGTNRNQILIATYNEAEPPDVADQEFQLLLHGLYILEYRNDDLWYDVHPIVIDILRRRKLVTDGG